MRIIFDYHYNATIIIHVVRSRYSNPLTGEKRPREFILVCGEDTERKGFGRVPSWRNGGVCYTGEPGVDAL